MDCFNCKNPYNFEEKCPRLLVGCGHSICEKCLKSLFANAQVKCPECGFKNEAPQVTSFPKNLALVQMNIQTSTDKAKQSSKAEVPKELNKDQGSICSKHGKHIEAFCENDRHLLCISCILEDGYKNHEISSLQIAAQKERHLMEKAYDLSQIMEAKLKATQILIGDAFKSLTGSSEKIRTEITNFFNEIRKALTERETALKKQLSSQTKKENSLLKSKEKDLTRVMDSLTEFYYHVTVSRAQSDIELLRNSSIRLEVIKKATQGIDPLNFSPQLTQFDKEGELSAILKLLNPKKSKETPNNTGSISQSNKNIPQNEKSPIIINLSKKQTKENTAPSNTSKQQISKNGSLPQNRASGGALIVPVQFVGTDKAINILPVQTSSNKEKSKDSQIDSLKQNLSSPRLKKAHTTPKENIEIAIEHPLAEKIEFKLQKSTKSSTPKKISISEKEANKPKHKEIDLRKQSTSIPKPRGKSFHCIENSETLFLDQPAKEDDQYAYHKTSPSRNDSFRTNYEILKMLDHGKEPAFEFESNTPKTTKSTKVTDNILRAVSDVTDMTYNKLDFSMLCQNVHSNIFIFGGFVENSQLYIEKFDIQKGKWEIAGGLLCSRTKFSTAIMPNGNILILGGKKEGNRTSTCEEYSPKDLTIRPSSINLTTNKSGFGIVNLEDELLICGGNDGQNILKTFESYSYTKNKWSTLPSMNQKRDELAVVLGPDQRIYAIGGFGGSNQKQCLSSVERYDPQRNCWDLVASLKVPRRALTAVSLPDGIYAIGGYDGESYLNTVEKYDEVLNEWTLVAPMSTARCTLAACASADFQHIYVMGGFDNGPLKTCEKYSLINNKWESLPAMHFKRFMHSCMIVNSHQSKV